VNPRLVDQVANQSHIGKKGSVPSPIRRKAIELQEIADEAYLRASLLEWMMDSFPADRKEADHVRTLREEAARLRRTAFGLLARAESAPSTPVDD